ncbi:MAG: right-handed parallel beta-helix repeat-containing protein [Verrucomicrobia bacterium]|nr:right-handed parallel beta-helix repeat-containing protein [Verrucomicrobiota bacterium]MDA1068861.1 right-handed parallel beta-helix repeat-containing protein [Verrucomicrobiota bacterium]
MNPRPPFFLIYTFCAVLLFVELQSATHGPINSAKSFSDALQLVQAGDIIIVANGRYNGWVVELGAQGTLEKPVTIRPESAMGVTFSGFNHFSITGSYVTISGFLFDGCRLDKNLLEFEGSDHCRIEETTFQHSGGEQAVIGIKAGARYNSLVDCRFINIAARSVNLHINEEIYKRGVPTGNIIRNNHFQDIPPANQNGRETIKIGTNQPTFGHVMVNTIIEDNTFLRCDGEAEIISNKCAGNIYRRNVFIECKGELVMRGGQNCLIEANRFDSCSGGIRLCGTGHIVRDNVIINSSGTGIRLFFGMTKEQAGHYQAAGNCLIMNNTIVNAGKAGILIGDSRGKDWKEKGVQNVAPEANRILNNIIVGSTGDLLLADHAPNNTIDGNLFHRLGDADLSMSGDNPLYGDPLFRDLVAGDVRPGNNSPALVSDPPKGASFK